MSDSEISYSASPPMVHAALRIFTDGSCMRNGQPDATAGVGVHFPRGEFSDISVAYHGTSLQVTPDGQVLPSAERGLITNQRAELEAIHVALRLAALLPPQPVHVYSDSAYAINALTEWIDKWARNDWLTSGRRPVKNRDLIEPIYALKQRMAVQFYHTAAHTNGTDEYALGNAAADRLALAASGAKRRRR